MAAEKAPPIMMLWLRISHGTFQGFPLDSLDVEDPSPTHVRIFRDPFPDRTSNARPNIGAQNEQCHGLACIVGITE